MNPYGKLEHLMHIANTIWYQFIEEHKVVLNGRKGLYLLAFDREHWKSVGTLLGGFEDESKILEKTVYATEKICRLEENYLHSTSFRTQNYKTKKFGGGIATKEFIIAGSGFLPPEDHLFCLNVLRSAGSEYITPAEIKKIEKEFEKYKNHGIT